MPILAYSSKGSKVTASVIVLIIQTNHYELYIRLLNRFTMDLTQVYSGAERVFENRILRRICAPKRDANGEGSTMRNFIIFTVHLI